MIGRRVSRDVIIRRIEWEFGSLGHHAAQWAVAIAGCESTYNPQAKNDHSSASGLFQFMPSTYTRYGGKDIWNWQEQITIVKKMYELHQQQQWECNDKV